jgi:hypothetical protein
MGEVKKFNNPKRECDFRIMGRCFRRRYGLAIADEWNTLTIVPIGWLWY